MVEFNPDGSIKLPGIVMQQQQEREKKLTKERSMLIKKEVVNTRAPKSCVLHLRISEAITDMGFVEKLHMFFKKKAMTPTKIIKISEREFKIEVGTAFRRCTECNSLINRYKEFLYENIIIDKGNCEFEQQRKNFCYEDYFD